ncbi:hypothetical protein JKP88DRAFT_284360 [Tribonema minus]|uniref:Uncharacterized protein n=1 Tax=Tribonema minus TaxID=303371 RepID=A0A835ZEQ3_9STRA|nr:hypothetical protein JKP88DRAFT_284360 [Tribonema minus]
MAAPTSPPEQAAAAATAAAAAATAAAAAAAAAAVCAQADTDLMHDLQHDGLVYVGAMAQEQPMNEASQSLIERVRHAAKIRLSVAWPERYRQPHPAGQHPPEELEGFFPTTRGARAISTSYVLSSTTTNPNEIADLEQAAIEWARGLVGQERMSNSITSPLYKINTFTQRRLDAGEEVTFSVYVTILKPELPRPITVVASNAYWVAWKAEQRAALKRARASSSSASTAAEQEEEDKENVEGFHWDEE